jgi:methanogenic corrinoid protein MtbC1
MHAHSAHLNAGTESWISCLTYQSRAITPLAQAELDALGAQAQKRNHELGVTGMLLYDNGRFLQTLEGPPDALAQVWQAIRRDPRHHKIEVLTEHVIASRLFSGWDLLVYSQMSAESRPGTDSALAANALAHYVPQLARLALDGDDARVNAHLAEMVEQGWSADDIVSHLIEPVARAMGDAWLADRACEFDLTIGLSMLQLAGHAVRTRSNATSLRQSRYSILLATAPGEPHMLSTVLLADHLTDAGWRVEMAFPESRGALLRKLAEQQHDVVDIGLSDAYCADTAVARLRDTVALCRQALPEQPVVISVGGRLFAEAAATAASVGADHARRSISGTGLHLAELVRRAREQS